MIEMVLSGFLFLFILVLNVAMGAFGYIMEKDDYDPDADLKKINNNPKKFKTGIGLALIEHGCVILLTILLFIISSPYSMLLGIILLTFRIGEGLIQSINEPNYWSLIKLAEQHSDASDVDKNAITDLAGKTFKTKDRKFKFAMICWSIGTLAFSIVLATSEIAPHIIGWLGIVSSILVGFGTGIKLLKPKFRGEVIGGLSAIIFEIIIGGYLLISPFI
jgi:hypothetical protein